MVRADTATPPEPESPPGKKRPNVVFLAIYGVIAAVVISMAVVASFQNAGQSPNIHTKATLIAPAGSGGGWDTFMRESQNAMRENGLGSNIQVLNVPGAAGTIGLSKLSTMTGRADVAMVGGTGQMAGVIQTNASVTLDDVTPIARIVEEYNVIVVRADSEFQTLEDMIQAWTDDPGSVPFTGGGSFDELVMAELAIAAGIEPSDAVYIPKSGGGEVAQALVTRTAAAGSSGFPDVKDQIEGGRLRALGLAAPEPLDGVDIPTLKEQGYDVTLTNWRAIFGAPGITDEQKEELRQLYEDIVDTPEWKDAVARYQWSPVWLDGAEFDQFMEDEEQRITELYEELGQ